MRVPVALLALLLVCPSARAEEPPVRFALVIGENTPSDPHLENLRYADDDAVTTHRLLTQMGVNSVLLTTLDPDSQRLYPDLTPDGMARLDELMEAFQRQAAAMREQTKAGKRTEFLFYYSGHGNVEYGQGYITLGISRLTRDDLFKRILSASPADRNHVIVDACKSYFLVFEKGPGGKRRPYGKHFIGRSNSELLEKTGFVLSTSSDRDSHEWERYQAGIFSHEVRSALRGAADVDSDRRITYAELGAFLTVANHQIANPRYRPDFVIRPPGNAPGDHTQEILGWPDNQNVLTLDRTSWGHVYIENSRGERLADAHPAEGQVFALHLPPERPMYLRRADEKEELVWEQGESIRVSELKPRDNLVARKGALHLAFENLFEEPFGKAGLAAYQEHTSSQGDPFEVIDIKEVLYDPGPRPLIQEVAQWTALGSLALGVGLNLWGYQVYEDSRDDSQAVQNQRNQTIERLNIAAGVFYSIAGAAVVTWVATALWPSEEFPTDLAITPLLGPDTVGLGVGWRWGD